MAKLYLTIAALVLASGGIGQAEWRAVPFAGSLTELTHETRQAGGGLPDGLITTHEGGDIATAFYDEPTERYGHGIMGDAIEAGRLSIITHAGQRHDLDLPQSEVFEDRYPRLADLDGDGLVEVITIRSSVHEGAAVTIYGLESGHLRQKATTPFIGRSNRWLNIAGIAPFVNGEGLQIAYVTTPHIGGTLALVSYQQGVLRHLGDAYGFSNHAIGSRELRLSAIGTANGRPILALPSADRRHLRIMSFGQPKPQDIASVPLPARIDKAIAATASGFVVGLRDGQELEIVNLGQ